MSWQPRNSLPLAPVVAAGLLGLGLVAQAALPWETPLPLVPPPRAGRGPVRVADRPLPLVPAVDIRARTLFTPSRAIGGGAVGEGGAAAQPQQVVTLVGTGLAGTRAIGLFRDGSGVVVSARVGGQVSGWRVVALGRSGAAVERGGERRVLRLGQTAGQTGAGEPAPEEETQ